MTTPTTLLFSCRITADGTLLSAQNSESVLTFEVVRGIPQWRVDTPSYACRIECEDATTFSDGRWHDVAITIAPRGTHIFIDGYLAMCGTSTLGLQDIEATQWHFADSADIRDIEVLPGVLTEAEIAAHARKPRPLVEFAAERLSSFDADRLSDLYEGTIWVRFRTRGHGQTGTILSAGSDRAEKINLFVDTEGITYRAVTSDDSVRIFRVEGAWGEGDWHDLAVRVGQGAVDLYVDGFREAHIPGQVFFTDTLQEAERIDTVTIGQDIHGRRLFGEALSATIYDHPLSDAQIKRLSQVKPLITVPVFDRGLHGAVSYRIPSLLALPTGELIAGADQRTSIPNDSPNHIQFVVRRSVDNGATWEDMQLVIPSEGSGRSGASMIDSCSVFDANRGRLVVLIDHYPGGIGQFNAVAGIGVDRNGKLLPYEGTPDDGLTRDDSTTLELPTSYLCVITSDDGGRTWSPLRHINHQVKEEWMTFLGTGPGTGIQLQHGAHKGRLVIPVYISSAAGDGFAAGVVYSDDGGDTWHRGATAPGTYPGTNSPESTQIDAANPPVTPKTDATYESAVVERADGSLVIFMRNQHPSGRVAVAHSHDGGESWGQVSHHPDLPEIFSQPNAITLSDGAICFANASQLLPFRGNGYLRLSFDEGASFSVSRNFHPGRYVYQSMTELPDGGIGLLWENEWQGLYYTTIPRTWFPT